MRRLNHLHVSVLSHDKLHFTQMLVVARFTNHTSVIKMLTFICVNYAKSTALAEL